MTTIKQYQDNFYQLIEESRPRLTLYGEIDAMNNCDFTMPGSLQALSWIKNRKFVSIAPKVAIQGAIRLFASTMPRINIDPMSGLDKDWTISDKIERGVEWMFDQMNRRGEQTPYWKIIESAALYSAVTYQTEYLPHSLRGKTGPKYDELRRRSPFNFVVHHPGTVFPSWGKHGLEGVLLARMGTVQEMVDEYGMENPGIVKLLSRVQVASPRVNLRKINVQFYDYTDYEWRIIIVTMAGERKNFSNKIEDEVFVLLKERHGMGFINWVVVDTREPILKPLVDGEVWKNANILSTIQQSMFIALAAHPRYWTNTPSGKGAEIDYDDPNNSLDLKPGETAGNLDNPEIDPGLAKAVADIESQMFEATAPRVISSAEKLVEKGAAFSTINAIVQLGVSQLALARRTAEQAIEEGIYQMFRWIDMSQTPLFTRMARTDRGQNPSISLVPGALPRNAAENEVSFNLDELYIKVELQAQSLVDESGRINNAIQKYEKLGIAQATAMEEVGIDHPDHEQKARLAEEARGIMPQKAGGNNFPASQGIETSKGGVTAQQYAPAQTREKITGKTKAGEDIVQ